MALFNRSKKNAQNTSDAPEAKATDTPSESENPLDEATEMVAESAQVEVVPAGTYRKVRIKPGKRGWGVGLEVHPQAGKDLIYSVTGGGIHPVAQRIADLSGGRPFDGFKSKAGFDEIACAVIDCGGTARIGVYPMKNIPTVDVHGASPSGPLIRFINEENFVSGVGINDIEVID